MSSKMNLARISMRFSRPMRLIVVQCLAGLLLNIAIAGDADAEPVGAIAGTIVDADGQAVRGASIALFRRGGFHWKQQARLSSGETGSYRFAELPEGQFRLAVSVQDRATAYHEVLLEEGQELQADVIVKAADCLKIQLKDGSGLPIAGARLRECRVRGENGTATFFDLWLTDFGIDRESSDCNGMLRLPKWSKGCFLSGVIEHPQFAPVAFTDLQVDTAPVQLVMKPGVRLVLRIAHSDCAKRLDSMLLQLEPRQRSSPSRINFYQLPILRDEATTLTVEAGEYELLRLEHEDVFVAPQLEAIDEGPGITLEPGTSTELSFEAFRKRKLRGRVIDLEHSRPLPDVWIQGEIENQLPEGAAFSGLRRWGLGDFADTRADGTFEFSVPEGRSRVSVQSQNLWPDSRFVELCTAPEGVTTLADIRVRPVPKVAGKVLNPDGSPASGAVVRIRGKRLRWMQPVVTDEKGHFELQPAFIPTEGDGSALQRLQPLVAFDLRRPLAGRLNVELGKSEPVVVRLEHHDPAWLFTDFKDELSNWERGARETRLHPGQASLRGQPAPSIDGGVWLNAGASVPTLTTFRGKYVLFQFWFSACEPCHREFQALRLLQETFRDRLVVVGIHNNSATPESVSEHITKFKLEYPILVDNPDGSILAGFQAKGLAPHFPSYVLLDPEGRILLDDQTIPHPRLWMYKLEILRQFMLMAAP